MGGRASVAAMTSGTSTGRALRHSLRAVLGESWLASLGMAVTLLRGACAVPASAFLAALSWLSLRGAVASGSTPEEAIALAASILASPRVMAIALGLWLSGWLLWGAVRVAWISGSLAALGSPLSGVTDGSPRFAAGVAYRFGRVLGSALLALLLDLAGQAALGSALIGAVIVSSRARELHAPAATGALVAAAVALSAFAAASLSVVGDGAVARAALAGDPPGRAVGRSALAFARRPAAFLAAALGVLVATALAVGSVQSFFGVLATFATGAPRFLLAGSQLFLAALLALLAAAAELWRLSAIGVLALGADPAPEEPARA